MAKSIVLAALGYIVGTFFLGYVWHLVLFREVYDAFGVYTRKDPIIPMGLGSMVLQGFILAGVYAWLHGDRGPHPLRSAIVFNLLIGTFFASGTVLALAAKAEISHLGAWFGYNTAFSLLQFLLSGIVFGFVFRGSKA
jgi:hypothetical protein